ncbi:MAG: hypothetical protein R3C05_25995 [Pirellulaceae bacterium]
MSAATDDSIRDAASKLEDVSPLFPSRPEFEISTIVINELAKRYGWQA